MNFKLLQTVVLERDLPEHGLRKGDVGTVVEVYGSEGVEVEFVTASGDTTAVLSLEVGDIRKATEDDMLTVRDLRHVG